MREKNNNIIGIICGIKSKFNINNQIIDSAIINFLCIHTEWRSKGYGKQLINEMINVGQKCKLLNNTIFTGPDKLEILKDINIKSKPFGLTSYYFRYLNIKKLIQTGFMHKKNQNIIKKFFEIKQNNVVIRRCKEDDMKQMYYIYERNLKRWNVSIFFSNKEELYNYYKNVENTIHTYVIERNGKVTDWVSFYEISYKLTGTFDELKTANLLRIELSETNIVDVMNQLFNVCKNDGFDIFMMLNIMGIENAIDELKLRSHGMGQTFHIINSELGIINPNKLAIVIP